MRAKINLDTPADSRLVVRLRDEFHNCWTDCGQAAAIMLAAVQNFANSVPVTQVDPQLVLSKALTLYEGTVASGGNRYEIRFEPLADFSSPGELSREERQRRVQEAVIAYARCLERYAREAPDNWFNFHDFWSRPA